MFKNIYFRLGLLTTIFCISILAALPVLTIKFNKFGLNIDTSIGGYFASFFGGSFNIDLRELKKGLDLEGGIRVVLGTDMSKIAVDDQQSALESAKEVIERRVNYLGVTEPVINTAKVGDEYRIIVEIPGITDTQAAVSLIGQTAQLEFKELTNASEWSEDKFYEFYMNPTAWKSTDLSGADLRGATVVFSSDLSSGGSSAPQIQLLFTPEGKKKFANLAKKNVGKPVALFLDQEASPLSMPVVSADLADGVFQDPVITGNFDVKSANALSLQIRAGALPIPVKILEQKTVGATLGQDSVEKSMFAGLVGMFFVMLFMLVFYGRLGLIANVALILYTALTITIFKIVPVVLTLPGIAGFILSVGMAVDANILIFERIKEEIRWGVPATMAIKFGFDRAWHSIKDSNVSSLITAFILFHFGNGIIRGFALTLSIGIMLSLFTSIFATRTLIQAFNVVPRYKDGGQDANN